MPADEGPVLLPQHAALIEGSGISREVAEARGYFTATTKSVLETMGFSRAQQNVPALVIPIYGVTGELVTYQIRPDRPRIKDGKPLKYETPAGSRMAIDVPRPVRGQLGDPAVPLFVTEGARKADSAVSHGLCCISVLGVWNWRGKNEAGGKVALPDWELVALNGREVYLCWDSDVTTKTEVMFALRRLKNLLELREAKVRVVYLLGSDAEDGDEGTTRGTKVGLDDYLAAGGDVDRLTGELADDEVHPRPRHDPSASTATLQRPSRPPALASSPDLLRGVATALQHRLAGEVRLAKLAYLAATSRLLDGRPVSLAVKGPSAAGKSHLLEVVLSLFPAEAYYAVTAMSEHSLVYDDEPLSHRMLVLYEADMLSGGGNDRDPTSHFADYLLRSLLSEGRIRYPTVEKDESGHLHTRMIEREGPTGLLTTTTAASLHPENETRLISITVDDSKQQTKAVMRREAASVNGEQGMVANVEPWHALQAWLQGMAPQQVVVHFADQLAELIPPLAVRLRRDFPMLLCLVRTHALLRQQFRRRDERGRIVATLDDYAVVRELVADLMAEGVAATVSASLVATVKAVEELLGTRASVTVAQLAEKLDLDKSATSRRVRVCIQKGFLKNQEDRRGRPSQLVLGDPLPADVTLLPTVDEVRCCTVARDAEGPSGGRGAPAEKEPPVHTPKDPPAPRRRGKRCPEGRLCSLTTPTAGWLCCGHPQAEEKMQ